MKSRRFFLAVLLALLSSLLFACNPKTQAETIAATLTIKANTNFNAWIVTELDGDNVAEVNVENTPWKLGIGKRYRIINSEGSEHPFELLNAANEPLLAQFSNFRKGSLENDATINFVANSDGISFTVTQTLANQLEHYYCFFHPLMKGNVISN